MFKVHLVRKRTSFIGSKEIDHFHYYMFHGREEVMPLRNSKEPRRHETVTGLWINTFRDIPIRQPSVDWIVSGKVAEILSSVPLVQLETCKVLVAISVPFEEGNFSQWDDPALRTYAMYPEKVYTSRRFLDRRGITEPLFRVHCKPLEEVASHRSATHLLKLPGKDFGGDDEDTLFVSEDIWTVSKLYHYGSTYVLHNDLLQSCRHFLPQPYYTVETKVSRRSRD